MMKLRRTNKPVESTCFIFAKKTDNATSCKKKIIPLPDLSDHHRQSGRPAAIGDCSVPLRRLELPHDLASSSILHIKIDCHQDITNCCVFGVKVEPSVITTDCSVPLVDINHLQDAV